jgi:hypothetical protein
MLALNSRYFTALAATRILAVFVVGGKNTDVPMGYRPS